MAEIAAELIKAGAAALHEAECADELCWREEHASYRSQPNEEIAETVLEGALPLIAAGRSAINVAAMRQHAAPEAIEHQLKAARREQRRADGVVDDLEVLLVQRRRQIAEGEWPAKAAGER